MRAAALLAAGCLAMAPAAAAQGVRPPTWRIGVDAAGGFVQVAGPALTDPTVDRLIARGWSPGLTLEVQVRPWLQFATAVKPPMELRLEERWGFGDTRDGRATVDHWTGAIHTLEARIMPFKAGWFAAVGLMHARPATYRMSDRRTGPTMVLGDAAYATDVVAEWRARPLTAGSLGLGYTRRVRRGMDVTAGISVPTAFPRQGPVHLRFDPAVDVTPADQDHVVRRLQDEVFYAPIAFHLALAWTR